MNGKIQLTEGYALDPWAFTLKLLVSYDRTGTKQLAYLGEHLHLG